MKRFFDDVLQLDAFVSSQDIPGGEDWFREVRGALANAKFGIVVLTASNLYAPWLFYEYGAIRAVAERRCCPILFGVKKSEMTGPLQQVQAVDFTEPQVRTLVREIHDKLYGRDWERTERRFVDQWPRLEKTISEHAAKPEQSRHLPVAQPTYPATLEFLYERWKAKHGGREGHEDFRLHTFTGIDGVGDGVFREVQAVHNRESVFGYWADAQRGDDGRVPGVRPPSVLVAQHLSDPYRLRVTFDNQPDCHPGTITIRPAGRGLLRSEEPDGFSRLRFDVRVPRGPETGDAGPVQVGVRVVDAYQTHWNHVENQFLKWFKFGAGEWQPLEIDLADRRGARWRVFESDGNWFYAGDKPDFRAVLGVVLEVGACGGSTSPSPGRGTVEFKDFVIDNTPVKAPARGRA